MELGLQGREAQAQFGDAERWRELTNGMSFGRAATPEEITVDGGGISRRSAL